MKPELALRASNIAKVLDSTGNVPVGPESGSEGVKDVFTGMFRSKPRRERMVQRSKRVRNSVRTRVIYARNTTQMKSLSERAFLIESKGLSEHMEVKAVIRHVRTAAGVKKYGQPIGTIIIADSRTGGKPLANLKMSDDQPYEGYKRVTADDGNEYDIGADGNVFTATGAEGEWDDLVVDNAKDEVEAFVLLSGAVSKGRKQGDKPVMGTGKAGNVPQKAPNKPKPVTAPKPTSRRSATASRARTATTRKKPAGLTLPKLLAVSGGDRDPSEKDGVELVGTLDPKKPTGRGATIKKALPKVDRQNPDDYHMRNGKPVQTDALRRKAHLRASGSSRAYELADEKGKQFKLAPARDNEHLWFPKDESGDVAYSFRQANPKLDKNGDPVYKVNSEGKKEMVYDGTYGPRLFIQTKEAADRNKALKDIKIVQLAQHMHKLDAALMKDVDKNDDAASVALMRVLGIRPNTMDEEAQAKNLKNKSPLKAKRLREAGIDPTQPIFGATSLRAKHIKFEGNKVIIDFMGKEHVRNTHVTDDPFIVNMLKKRMRGKKGETQLFPGTNADTTQNYICAKLGSPSVTNKDLRAYVASELAIRLKKDYAIPMDRAQFQRQQAEIAGKVAMTLNNVARQALGSYIAAPVWNDWEAGI